MRGILAVGYFGLVGILIAGCTDNQGGIKPIPAGATATSSQTAAAIAATSPTATLPPVSTSVAPPTPVVVTPDKADALLLSGDDVGRLVGASLTFEVKSSQPPTVPPGHCHELELPNNENLGSEWTTYRSVVQQETKDRFEHVVWQSAVLYPDAKAAAAALQQAYPATLNKCNNVTSNFGDADWRYSVDSLEPSQTKWSREQLQDGNPTGWHCYFEYRVKNNALFGTRLCQAGNGRPALTAIVDRMAEWIPA